MVTLANSRLLGGLPSDALTPLLDAAEERRFPDGGEVFREGEEGDGLYVVQEGRVEISGAITPERRVTFTQVGPGEHFGEMAVVEDKPRSATAVAMPGTNVVFIPREAARMAILRSPELAIVLLREISQRLREFNRQYLTDVLQTERLAIVGRFARAVIHDLKSPLNIISLTAELAGLDTTPPELRTSAPARIRRQVERITDLVNEVLDFTQVTPAALETTPLDYGEFVRNVLGDLADEIETRRIGLTVEAPPPGVIVRLNPRRFQRVFQNLIHNALDVMTDGGGICLRCYVDAGQVITKVADTGPGIAPEIADRLFEAFATHGKAHGTGLGLSICKKTVEDHGGEIWARNAPEGGAVFGFRLPVVPPSRTAGSQGAPS